MEGVDDRVVGKATGLHSCQSIIPLKRYKRSVEPFSAKETPSIGDCDENLAAGAVEDYISASNIGGDRAASVQMFADDVGNIAAGVGRNLSPDDDFAKPGTSGDEGTPSGSLCADNMDCSTDDGVGEAVFFRPIIKDRGSRKRVYNKHQACCFCSKLVTKVSKHLLKMHRNQDEVRRIAAMEVGSRERANAFELLRNRGNYYHNRMVHTLKQGEIIVVRRPSDADNGNSAYVPCPDCLGFYLKSDLWKHQRYFCIAKEKSSDPPNSSQDTQLESVFLIDEFPDTAAPVEDVLAGTKQDKLSEVVQNDSLIIQLGNTDTNAHPTFGVDPHRERQDVLQEMRTAAKLLLNLQSISKSGGSMSDFIAPRQFNRLVEAVLMTAGQVEHNDTNYEAEHPSVAVTLGHSLEKLAAIKRRLALDRGDTDAVQEAESFLKLKEAEWADRVLSVVQHPRECDKAIELPDSQDVKTFALFVEENIRVATCDLQEHASVANFQRCSELVLARLTTFNKQKAEEIEQMPLRSYTSRPSLGAASISEIEKDLTPLERHLVKDLDMVYTCDTRGRTVPILIPAESKRAMDQLVSFRPLCGIPNTNPYFFARPGCDDPLRAMNSLQDLAQEARLMKPHLLRTGTTVGNYTATISQILNLKVSQLDWLAEHLEHSLQGRPDSHRLSVPNVELAKLAQLLLAVDSGYVGQFVSKSVGDLQLEDIPIPEVESNIKEESQGLPD